MEISPRYKFISEKHIVTLLIYEVQPADAGTYEVRVTNNVGMSRSTATLTLKEPSKPRAPSPPAEAAPQLVKPLEVQTVEEGKSTVLSCVIRGSPSKCYYKTNYLTFL